MGFLRDVLDFERFNLKDMGRKLRKDPERLLLGAVDPFSSNIWGRALGKDYEPIVDQMGGAYGGNALTLGDTGEGVYGRAKEAGVPTQAGSQMHDVAHIISSIFAGGYGASKLGLSGSGGMGRFPTPQMPQQQQQQTPQVQAMRVPMASRNVLLAGNLNPSPNRSAIAQMLLARSLNQPRMSGSVAESASIAAAPILAALLTKREDQAQARQNEQTAARQQALAGALMRSQSGGAQGEAARRASMMIAGGLPEDPVAQQLLMSQAKGLSNTGGEIGVANPSDFEPSSLAKYKRSGNPADLVPRTNVFGRYTPSQYTTDSWAQFVASGDPSALIQRPEYRFQQTPSGALVAGNNLTGQVSPTAVTPQSAIDEASQRARATSEATAQGQATGTAQGALLTRAFNADNIGDILDIAEPLINEATGSGTGAMRDKLAAFFGESTSGAQAIAQLLPLQAALMLNQPRMEGPQSDRDVQLYREAAGQLGDPTVPRETKLAAIKTIRRLQEQYKSRANPSATPATPNDINSLLDKYAPVSR